MKKGLLIVVSSPSGGGKGTILKALFERNANLRMSVSATTRAPREGEQDGVHYHFITREQFQKNIAGGAMLEYAEYCENYYGTPKAPIQAWLDAGHDVVLEIEVQGGRQIKTAAPDCVSLFILPPSLEVLEKRLRGRGTEAGGQKAPAGGGGRNPLRKGLRLCRRQRHGRAGRGGNRSHLNRGEAPCFPRKQYC